MAVLLLATACASPSVEPPTVPTRAPAPTFTPTTAVAAPPPAAEQPAVEQPAVAQPAVEQPQEESVPEVAQPPAAEPAVEPIAEPIQEIVEEPAAAPEPAAAEVIVNTQLLNVRGGPGTNYETVSIVDQGERFDVTGKNNAGDWWQIEFNGQRGWVFDELVITNGTENVAAVALIPAPPPPTQAPVVVVPPTQPPPPTQQPLNATQIAYYTAVAQGPIQPTAPPPTPVPPAPEAPAEPPPPAEPSYPFQLIEGVEKCEPNAGITYFEGFVRYKSNDPRNAVCVHIGFFGPRTTKCSGCDGVGAGKWGFSPFGGPAPDGTSVEIFVVSCPSDLPAGGQNSGFSDLTPRSKKWTRTINSSEQCSGITFVGDE